MFEENKNLESEGIQKRGVPKSIWLPALFVLLLWAIKLAELASGVELYKWGVLPRTWEGLKGIITYPLIHGNSRGELLGHFDHLFSNSVPLLVLGFMLLESYRSVAAKVFAAIWLISGFWIWVGANPTGEGGYHIGASGIVYGLAFFIFFSGVFRKDTKSIALALLVAFLYGSMVWGLLPIQPGVSWEGHVAGALAGSLMAWRYRKVDLPPQHVWEEEEGESGEIVEEPFWVQRPASEPPPPDGGTANQGGWQIHYIYTPKKPDDGEKDGKP